MQCDYAASDTRIKNDNWTQPYFRNTNIHLIDYMYHVKHVQRMLEALEKENTHRYKPQNSLYFVHHIVHTLKLAHFWIFTKYSCLYTQPLNQPPTHSLVQNARSICSEKAYIMVFGNHKTVLQVDYINILKRVCHLITLTISV